MFEIVFAPHSDDETLFCAYTIIRQKPLVIIVTDSYNQGIVRHDITAEMRRRETIEACKILGAPVMFLGIRDDELTEEALLERIEGLNPDRVYAPAIQGGHPHHDIVGLVAQGLWAEGLRQYSTYSKDVHFIREGELVVPTAEEMELKNQALDKYVSQIKYDEPHFIEVRNKEERFIC